MEAPSSKAERQAALEDQPGIQGVSLETGKLGSQSTTVGKKQGETMGLVGTMGLAEKMDLVEKMKWTGEM